MVQFSNGKSKEIQEVFNSNDFENDYFRTIGLVMFSNMIKINENDNGLARPLPPIEDQSTSSIEIEAHNVFPILINSKNKILANGCLAEVSDLKPMIKKFLLETSDKVAVELPEIGKHMSSKGIISIRTDKGTSYEFYLLVQNELSLTYNEVRDIYSHKLYNLDFEKLSEVKKSIIKKIVPQRIIENDPISK